MTTRPCYPRIALLHLIVPLFLAIPLAAQPDDKQGAVSLTVEPARITLSAGQTQRFSAEVKGAPAATVIIWAVREQGGNISQDGVFTARIVGIYHVIAIATSGSITLKHAVAKVTVVAQYDGPVFR